jgi:undecaprenyl-diphosphatase
MLEQILDCERTLFLQLNGAHSPFADQLMWLYSGFTAWIPAFISFFIILFHKNRQRLREVLLIVAAIALVITLCDQFSSGLCKPFFARLRPTHHPDFMNDVTTVFDYRGGRFGFISSHAANGFGFAMLTSLIFRNKLYSVMLFLWASVSAYSRIYLGVHFISDIVPGILSGLLFGWIVFRLFVITHRKIFAVNNQSPYPYNGLMRILTVLIATVCVIAIVSSLYVYRIIPEITIP